MLWQICHNSLLTKSFLQQWQIARDSSCDICGHSDENIMLALRDCRWASKVWAHLIRPGQWHDFFRPLSPREWISTNIDTSWQPEGSMVEWRYIFCQATEAIHTIRYWRNEVVHGNSRLPPPIFRICQDIVHRANLQILVNVPRNCGCTHLFYVAIKSSIPPEKKKQKKSSHSD